MLSNFRVAGDGVRFGSLFLPFSRLRAVGVSACVVAASEKSVSLTNRGIKGLFPRDNVVAIESSNAMVGETISYQPYHMTV